ncbi:MAG: transglycosylase SLT domain-containing protein [Bacteroidaceae bacterium]|nr:transglycosylase SLT domain-containing protein [Bacteroidaceae bacterium]
MKHLSIISLFLLCCLQMQAQPVAIHKDSTTLRVENEVIPKDMEYELDRKLNDWQTRNYLVNDKECNSNGINPTFADSVYIDRLSRIPSTIEMPFNSIIRKYIDVYAARNREKVSFMLGASNFYMPLFEQALSAYNIPLELRYLPIIESALNPSAFSRAGASGLWQFMIGTGKIYGLVSNTLIDERRDPIKSTWAAAKYLKDLYSIYNDWTLVIAAYNCGPGNVNKAIRRTNGQKDYWAIYSHLPRETRGYVPAFVAANYIMTYYCKHNICPLESQMPLDTDTLHINKNLHFKQIAAICSIDIEEIESLNPQYIKQIIPGNTQTCTLRLPRTAISTFIDAKESVYNYQKEQLFTRRKVVAIKKSFTKRSSSRAIRHKIKRGESLSRIAQRYKVTTRQLKKWNHLKNSKIKAGKYLKVYK